MSENDIFGELDSRTNAADNGGDYADWWEPENPGDTLVGVIVEMHSAPQEWTEAGEVPETIYTVMSVGRGDHEAGEALTPKQHKQLKTGLEGAGLGTLVKLEFTGYEKVEGRGSPMNTYTVRRMSREEWEAMDGADEVQELLDQYNGVSGDNRRTEPYGTASGNGGSGSSTTADDSQEGQAASALKELVDIQGGSVKLEQAERILTEVRGFDVAVEDAALMAGLTVEGDTVRFPNEG
jgi:hypothetical protein